ncbi:ATP-binding cassette domain-containing protein [Bifidobacterium cuniculi]|nr:ATP-binding cassette domain-containing protein [Bifidobacterium cuniculi]
MSLLDSLLRRGSPAGASRVDINLERAAYRYGDGTYGLEPTSLDLAYRDDGHTAIIGLNGAGKSTLVALLGGRFLPTEGKVLLQADGTALSPDRRGDARRIQRLVGVVDAMDLPREFRDDVPLEEGFLAYLKDRHLNLSERTARTGAALNAFDLLEVRHTTVGSLDMERRHLLAVAIAMSHDPVVLVADEPMRGMDERGTAHVASRLFSQQVPVVFTTHNVDLTVQEDYRVRRTIVLDDAHVVFDGACGDARRFYTRLIRSKIQRMGSNASATPSSTMRTLPLNSSASGSSDSAR